MDTSKAKKMVMVNAILFNLRGLCPPGTMVRWARRAKLLRKTDGLAAITDFSWSNTKAKNGGAFIFHVKWLDDEGHYVYGTHKQFLANAFEKYCLRLEYIGDSSPKTHYLTRDLQIETSRGKWEIFQDFLPNAVRVLQPSAVAKWLVERDGILECPKALSLVKINTPPPVATFTFKSLRNKTDWTSKPFAEANKKLSSKPPRRPLPPPTTPRRLPLATPTPFPSPSTPIYHQSKLLASPLTLPQDFTFDDLDMSPLALDANIDPASLMELDDLLDNAVHREIFEPQL
jgi:hypothetical protein